MGLINQIIQRLDDTDGARKTVDLSESGDGVLLQACISGKPFGLQALYVDHDADGGDGAEITVEGSMWETDEPNDGWSTISSLTLDSAGNSGDIYEVQCAYHFAQIRVRLTQNDTIAGTLYVAVEA